MNERDMREERRLFWQNVVVAATRSGHPSPLEFAAKAIKQFDAEWPEFTQPNVRNVPVGVTQKL